MEIDTNIPPPIFLGVAEKFKEMEWKIVNLSSFVTYRGKTTMEYCFIARKTWQFSNYSRRKFTADVIYHDNTIYCFLEAHDPIFLGSIRLDWRFKEFLQKVNNFFAEVVATPVNCERAGPAGNRYVNRAEHRTPGHVCVRFRFFQDQWNNHMGAVDAFSFPVFNFNGVVYL